MTATSGAPVPRAGTGEGDAGFAVFYERELPVQVRRAAMMIGSPEVAHDLVHDAFVEVYRRWGGLRAPGPYLGRAVLNRCRDHGRRASTRARKLPLLVERGEPEDEPLWDALQQLPFNHRAAIVLHFYHDLTEQEIAQLIGCRPGSVGPWIQRGLRKLRKALA